MRFSTAGIFSTSPQKTLDEFKALGIIDLELSGLESPGDIERFCISYQSKGFQFHLHNYFVKEEKGNDFVMNLASTDDDIAALTKSKILKAVSVTSKLGKNFFSFHAGFFLNLNREELGRKFASHIYSEKEEAKSVELFFSRLENIALIANEMNVALGVETNVCTFENYQRFERRNPFMLASERQIDEFIQNKPRNVKILWDFGHVKVSSHTFGFEHRKVFKKSEEHIIGLHISDNDGISDQNYPVTPDNWCFHEARNFDYSTFEIYGKQNILKQLDYLKLQNVKTS